MDGRTVGGVTRGVGGVAVAGGWAAAVPAAPVAWRAGAILGLAAAVDVDGATALDGDTAGPAAATGALVAPLASPLRD